MRVTFNELAESELNDAAQYYELKRSGLGAAFIAEVQRCTAEIISHPKAAPITLGTIRRRLCLVPNVSRGPGTAGKGKMAEARGNRTHRSGD